MRSANEARISFSLFSNQSLVSVATCSLTKVLKFDLIVEADTHGLV